MNKREQIQVINSWLEDFPVPNQAKEISKFISDQEAEINKLVIKLDNLESLLEERERKEDNIKLEILNSYYGAIHIRKMTVEEIMQSIEADKLYLETKEIIKEANGILNQKES